MLAGPTRVGAGLHCNGVMPHAIRPPRPARAVHLPRSIGHSLKFIVIALVVAGLYFGRDILVPLALAALLGFVLDPLVSRLCRLGLRRGLAVGVVTSGTLSLLVGIGLLVGLQMVQLSSDLPRYRGNACPNWAIQGHTSAGRASMVIARVMVVNGSSIRSSPGRTERTSSSVHLHCSAPPRRRRYVTPAPPITASFSAAVRPTRRVSWPCITRPPGPT